MCDCNRCFNTCHNRCCENLIQSTAVAVVGGNLQITVPSITLIPCRKTCILVDQVIPVAGLGLPVVILSGATIIPLFKDNQVVRGYQIEPRTIYTLVYGNDPVAFGVCNCLYKNFEFVPVGVDGEVAN